MVYKLVIIQGAKISKQS